MNWLPLAVGVGFFFLLWWFIVSIKKASQQLGKKGKLDKNDYRVKLKGGIQ